MSDQFYQPNPGDLVACDDGMHFILLDEANAHCNRVMRRHPDGGLVSVRKATEHELGHAKARQHLRAGVAQLEESEGPLPEQEETKAGEPYLVAYHCVDQYGQKKVLLPGAEGIRRHILHGSILKQLTYMDTACRVLAERDALQQRLAEAEKANPSNWTDKQVLEFLGVALRNVDIVGAVMLHEIRQGFQFMAGKPITQTGFASPGCADGEKAE